MGKVATLKKTASAQIVDGAEAALHAVAPVLEARYKEVAERAGRAYEWASPQVRQAVDKALAAAQEYGGSAGTLGREGAQRVVGLSESVGTNLSDARDRLKDDYLPRLQHSAAAAAQAAGAAANAAGLAASAAGHELRAGVSNVAASVAPQPAPKKKCKTLKLVLVLGGVAAAGAAAYVVWRETRPQEDPWAPPADFSRPRYPVASSDEADDDSLAEAVGGAEAGDVAEALRGGDSAPKA
ncbi:hypothetical protein JT358_08135 [Micrococcales bacterium 31B]|nr:hypothetical protein [Micrococcales bacterium 31B]